MNILDWPDWTVIRQGPDEAGRYFLVEARPPEQPRPIVCRVCGVKDGVIYSHGYSPHATTVGQRVHESGNGLNKRESSLLILTRSSYPRRR